MIDTIILFLGLIPLAWGLADIIHTLKIRVFKSDSKFNDIRILYAEDNYHLFLKLSVLRLYSYKNFVNIILIDFNDVDENLINKCKNYNAHLININDIDIIKDFIERKVKNAK